MIKVSIIIPVYNVEKYLRECLDSAVSQTLEDIEIIVVNDGSTDGSLQIAKEYANKYEKIVLIDQENKGLSEARNAGMNVSSGKYVYFLDSDDYINKDLCRICYEECEEHNLDILSFDAHVFIDVDMKNKNFRERYDRKKLLSSEIQSGEDFYVNLRRKRAYASPVWLYFYNRDFLLHNDLSFYPRILHEDELFTPLALLRSKRIKYIPQKLYYRRIRENSIMTAKKSLDSVIGVVTVADQLYRSLDGYSGNVYEVFFSHIKILYKVGLNRISRASLQKCEDIKFIMNLDVTKELSKHDDIKYKIKLIV